MTRCRACEATWLGPVDHDACTVCQEPVFRFPLHAPRGFRSLYTAVDYQDRAERGPLLGSAQLGWMPPDTAEAEIGGLFLQRLPQSRVAVINDNNA